jgi:hypothetical protein
MADDDRAMPKFFFDVSDGNNVFKDREGSTLPSTAAAKQHARRIAHDLARDGSHLDAYVHIRNEDGDRLGRVPVSLWH